MCYTGRLIFQPGCADRVPSLYSNSCVGKFEQEVVFGQKCKKIEKVKLESSEWKNKGCVFDEIIVPTISDEWQFLLPVTQ